MSVIATLNIGSNGATSLNGNSTALSTPADRARFLQLHRSAGGYVLGRNSYEHESYSQSAAPIYILTRHRRIEDLDKPNLTWIEVGDNLAEAMAKIRNLASAPLVIEAGVALLLPLIDSGCVVELQLSISPVAGDSRFIDVQKLLSKFTITNEVEVDSTRLLECRYNGDSSYS
jgi:dihydrofolate reductase